MSEKNIDTKSSMMQKMKLISVKITKSQEGTIFIVYFRRNLCNKINCWKINIIARAQSHSNILTIQLYLIKIGFYGHKWSLIIFWLIIYSSFPDEDLVHYYSSIELEMASFLFCCFYFTFYFVECHQLLWMQLAVERTIAQSNTWYPTDRDGSWY
jgi:hypothetical protein